MFDEFVNVSIDFSMLLYIYTVSMIKALSYI